VVPVSYCKNYALGEHRYWSIAQNKEEVKDLTGRGIFDSFEANDDISATSVKTYEARRYGVSCKSTDNSNPCQVKFA
jgi:hypothetical protein